MDKVKWERSKMQKMRLINAYELRDLFEQNDDLYRSQDIRHVIENGVKPVDAAPIMHGHWEDETLLKACLLFRNGYHVEQARCSKCGKYTSMITDEPKLILKMYQHKYCPWCGAKMKGDD